MLPTDARPACTESLDLVDLAFSGKSRAANDAARELAKLCRGCPAAEACLVEGLRHREREGLWGGVRTVRQRLTVVA